MVLFFSFSLLLFPEVFDHQKSTGKFVSESKFTTNPALFIPPILARDRDALTALITKPDVERALLDRLRKKAATYAQDFDTSGPGSEKIDVDGVVELYESFIIPLTKEVEVCVFGTAETGMSLTIATG